MTKTHKAPELQDAQNNSAGDPFKPLATGDGTVILSVSQYQMLLQTIDELTARCEEYEAGHEVNGVTTALASEQSLAEIWLTREEDEAWADL